MWFYSAPHASDKKIYVCFLIYSSDKSAVSSNPGSVQNEDEKEEINIDPLPESEISSDNMILSEPGNMGDELPGQNIDSSKHQGEVLNTHASVITLDCWAS